MKFFVGSQYCDGLKTNFDNAIKQEAWGYITSPLHQENPVQRTLIEPWMVDDLREVNNKFKEVYNG